LSKDSQFAAKLRDIVGLYVNPPDNAIVLSVDEKSHVWKAPSWQLGPRVSSRPVGWLQLFF
jgi:hypothetical protein